MYKRPRKKQLGQDAIPTTSLADMMFLLLIFFIMTTTLARVTGFVSDMPAGQKGDSSQQKGTTVLLRDDKITLNDDNITMDELYRRLRGLHLEQKVGDAKVVVVSTAGRVKYQDYFEAMAAIENSGGVVAIETEGP
jgi:biopolymer transport protein ExbD